VTGRYAGRPFPTEHDLAQTHKVSRSVTREAVKMLTAKGLLTARPRQGTSVQPEAHGTCSIPMCCAGCWSGSFRSTCWRNSPSCAWPSSPWPPNWPRAMPRLKGLALIEAGYRRMVAAERGMTS
jgi:DNA-binding transcriptional MocR family regulator